MKLNGCSFCLCWIYKILQKYLQQNSFKKIDEETVYNNQFLKAKIKSCKNSTYFPGKHETKINFSYIYTNNINWFYLWKRWSYTPSIFKRV